MDVQKKTPTARERERPDVQERRQTFLQEQEELDASRLIFLDESGFRLGTPPHYGWAPKGKKAFGRAKIGGWKSMTMIGAIALDGFRGFMTINAATNTEVFRAFVDHELLPNLRAGDIVVMDNLSSHKNKETLQAIRNVGAEVLFTPPYSPEFNPIEQVWSKLKGILRRLETSCRDTFDAAVAQAMDAITTQDIRAWTRHAGYRLTSR